MTGLISSLSTEKSKTDEWKLTLKERHSSKVKGERVPPVGASADQSHDDISLRGEIIPQLFYNTIVGVQELSRLRCIKCKLYGL